MSGDGKGDSGPLFDDEFVKGGQAELSATERAIESARRAAAERARVLRDQEFAAVSSAARTARRRRRRLVTSRIAKVTVVLGVVGAGGWWVAGRPGLHHTPAPAAPVRLAGPAGVTVPSDVTTTTVLGLGNFDYGVGDCVTWDQAGTGVVQTSQVSCAKPHLVEVVSPPFQVTGFGVAYPGRNTLAPYYFQHCTEPAEQFLGYALDPAGRFGASAVGPSQQDWVMGSRTAQCTLQLRTNGPTLTPFSGEVRGANQEWLFAVGACGSPTASPVPCSGPHTWQVTGDVDVSGTRTLPTSDAGWQALVGAQCSSLTLAFLGGTYPAGVQTGWLTLAASSWAAGERTVQCTASHYPAGGGAALTVTGSLAGAGRR